jgi:hypothetical protein
MISAVVYVSFFYVWDKLGVYRLASNIDGGRVIIVSRVRLIEAYVITEL